MKDELEIFDAWFCERFDAEDVPDLLEYIALRDTIDFQSYLLQYRVKELFQPIGEIVCDLLMSMLNGIKYLLKNIRR